ncbi:YafY family protein [Paenibacillus sp. YYML68]|uniref:helix-turn-helix transcriptional regulator n=1 Tax=Paenibacillus sp. YYML68 TaxID=2909250 RepID=UPI00248FE296|nr:YafY family protein [Paenibacillus sp. YYML68]
MSKSKRLMELMIVVNKKRRFTVRELAEEFGVSTRTIMRDLQVLDELGLPLYAEYGPNGGYRVLNERLLPPIMFSEQEAVAMFFAYQSLQHYGALPFNEESTSALNKFYYYLPDDTKQKIDQMRRRVVFWTPKRHATVPYLKLLLEAALRKRPLQVVYDSRDGAKERAIQPLGVYSQNGYWYCPAYCFVKQKYRLFRADRFVQVEWTPDDHPTISIDEFPIERWLQPPNEEELLQEIGGNGTQLMDVMIRMTPEGVRRCRWESRVKQELELAEDGSGLLKLSINEEQADYFVSYFITFGADAIIEQPAALVERMRQAITRLKDAYGI